MSRASERSESQEERDEQVSASEATTTRDAIRSSQRLASQLHQLIAASITVATLRTEREILENLAASTRRVFDADTAVLTLDTGHAAPLRGVAHRGQRATSQRPGEGDEPSFPTRARAFAPWQEGDWLVAPL